MIDSMLIPHLVVSDGAAAVAFYEKAFGAKLEEKHLAEDGKRFMHAHVSFGKGALYLHDEFPEYGDHAARKRQRVLVARAALFILMCRTRMPCGKWRWMPARKS